MNDLFYGIFEWIKEDWASNRIRFSVELLAWAISVGCSLSLAFTVPNPPFFILKWAAWTRKSFGMLANYLLLSTIDTVGLIRLWTV